MNFTTNANGNKAQKPSGIEALLPRIAAGEVGVLIDDSNPAQSASFLFSRADRISEEQVSFLVNHGRGVICAVLSEARVRELGLPPMNPQSKANLYDKSDFDFLVSVEARQDVSTGISAHDRAKTLRTVATTTQPKLDLVMPGHIFPVRAKSGGVLVRMGPVEAVMDLMEHALGSQLADENAGEPACALTHVLLANGEIANADHATILAKEQKLPLFSVSEVLKWRLRNESIVECVSQADINTGFAGKFRAVAFHSKNDDAEHLALVLGDLKDAGSEPVLVRVQAEHRIGDLVGTPKTSRESLMSALQSIQNEGRGVLVYVRHPKRGYLGSQVASLGEPRKNTEQTALIREVGIGSQILKLLGVNRIRLLSNSLATFSGLESFDLEVVETVSFCMSNTVSESAVKHVDGTNA